MKNPQWSFNNFREVDSYQNDFDLLSVNQFLHLPPRLQKHAWVKLSSSGYIVEYNSKVI